MQSRYISIPHGSCEKSLICSQEKFWFYMVHMEEVGNAVKRNFASAWFIWEKHDLQSREILISHGSYGGSGKCSQEKFCFRMVHMRKAWFAVKSSADFTWFIWRKRGMQSRRRRDWRKNWGFWRRILTYCMTQLPKYWFEVMYGGPRPASARLAQPTNT